jgi:tellurite resistance protein TehA-like permease
MATFLIDTAQIPYVATFLLVFAIVFGLLSTLKHEKKQHGKVVESAPLFDKKVNAIISVVFALFAVLYEPLVSGLQEFMPFIATGLIVVFFIIFIKKLFSGDENKKPADYLPIVVSIAVLLFVLSAVGSSLLDFLPAAVDRTQAMWVIGIALILIIFYAVYHHEGGPVTGGKTQ